MDWAPNGAWPHKLPDRQLSSAVDPQKPHFLLFLSLLCKHRTPRVGLRNLGKIGPKTVDVASKKNTFFRNFAPHITVHFEKFASQLSGVHGRQCTLGVLFSRLFFCVRFALSRLSSYNFYFFA